MTKWFFRNPICNTVVEFDTEKEALAHAVMYDDGETFEMAAEVNVYKIDNCAYSGICDMEAMLGGFPNCYNPFNGLYTCNKYKRHCRNDPNVCPGDAGDIQCRTCDGCVLSKVEMAWDTHVRKD